MYRGAGLTRREYFYKTVRRCKNRIHAIRMPPVAPASLSLRYQEFVHRRNDLSAGPSLQANGSPFDNQCAAMPAPLPAPPDCAPDAMRRHSCAQRRHASAHCWQ
jgi:hypothetical protein